MLKIHCTRTMKTLLVKKMYKRFNDKMSMEMWETWIHIINCVRNSIIGTLVRLHKYWASKEICTWGWTIEVWLHPYRFRRHAYTKYCIKALIINMSTVFTWVSDICSYHNKFISPIISVISLTMINDFLFVLLKKII